MNRRRFDVWLANLNPPKGTEVGKVRPVLILQSDYFNVHHTTTIICPISSNPWSSKINHVQVSKGHGGLEKNSVILLDQIRSVDNQRLIQYIGSLPAEYAKKINSNLRIILDLI